MVTATVGCPQGSPGLSQTWQIKGFHLKSAVASSGLGTTETSGDIREGFGDIWGDVGAEFGDIRRNLGTCLGIPGHFEGFGDI